MTIWHRLMAITQPCLHGDDFILLGIDNPFRQACNGRVRSVTRDKFTELGFGGTVNGDTEVFDPSD